jgi:hypothetical protein
MLCFLILTNMYDNCSKIVISTQQQFSSLSSFYKLVKLRFTRVASIGDTTYAIMRQCNVTKFVANVVSYSYIVSQVV